MLLSASSFAERTVGPIGPGTPSAADHVRAKALGFSLRKPYFEIRNSLALSGWNRDVAGGSSKAFSEFPEIVCGSGMDAVCSARFVKDERVIILTVDQNAKTLKVVHINDE